MAEVYHVTDAPNKLRRFKGLGGKAFPVIARPRVGITETPVQIELAR